MIDHCLRELMEIGLFQLESKSDAEITARLPPQDAPEYSQTVNVWMFADWWAQSGFPRITLGHRHAAALMATRTTPSALSEVPAPWQALEIDAPEGLVEMQDITGATRSVTHACVLIAAHDVVMIHFGDHRALISTVHAPSLRDLGSFDGTNPVDEVLARLVLGVCLELVALRPTAATGFGVRPIERKRGLPLTWTFRLSRDVTIDCRAAVRDYVRGLGGTSPVVQSLVRGHWRRQPCGVAGAERKTVFIEPYWRGPEAAPIAVRAHKPGGPDEPPQD